MRKLKGKLKKTLRQMIMKAQPFKIYGMYGNNLNVHQQMNGLRRCGIYIYTNEYYSAIKKSKIMPFVATWVEIETLTLSEVSQKDKDKYHMISHICNLI